MARLRLRDASPDELPRAAGVKGRTRPTPPQLALRLPRIVPVLVAGASGVRSLLRLLRELSRLGRRRVGIEVHRVE